MLEKANQEYKDAQARKLELSSKFLKYSTESTFKGLEEACRTVEKLSQLKDIRKGEYRQAENDLKKHIENVEKLELKRKELYEKLDNVKHDRHVLEFSGEEIYRLMEEKEYNDNTTLMAWEALAHLRREGNTRYKHLRNDEKYKEVYNIVNDEFNKWRKQKNKEEASITQLYNRILEIMRPRKHGGQRENSSQPESNSPLSQD